MEIDPFTREEINKIVENTSHKNKAAILLLFSSGLRRGELLGLRICDINFSTNELKFKMSLKRVKKYNLDGKHNYVNILEETKTKSSIRTIPLNENIVPIFKKNIQETKLKFIKCGESFDENSLVFTTETCSCILGKTF